MSRAEEYKEMDCQVFLTRYYSKEPDEWKKLTQITTEAFNCVNSEQQNIFMKLNNLKYFDFNILNEFYADIKENKCFEDEILRYISFINALGYFKKIGNPPFELWINAQHFNTPFNQDKMADNGFYGCSIIELLKYKNGDNAVKSILLSLLKWI